jgi:hypothetical protein
VPLHLVVVDLAARAQVDLGVGEEVVRAEADDVVAAHVRVRPLELAGIGVALQEVAIPDELAVDVKRSSTIK